MRAALLALTLLLQMAACTRLRDGSDRLTPRADDPPADAALDAPMSPDTGRKPGVEPEAGPREPEGGRPMEGGPEAGDTVTTCGDGVVALNEHCDVAIAETEAGSCPASCAAPVGCTSYVLEGTGCEARCVEVPLGASAGDGCCPPGFTSAMDSDCQCTGGDCPACDDDHPCPPPFECCEGSCVEIDPQAICVPFPCVPGTSIAELHCLGCGQTCSLWCCSNSGATSCDGVEDCCPDDLQKTTPGQCGCGTPDVDSDGDSVADCRDNCQSDPDKAVGGVCGCGVPDNDQGSTAGCSGLRSALLHRYRFEGSGTAIVDSRGDRDGTAVNCQLGDTGALQLGGGTSDQYVDLPNGIVSALTDATFEAWVTWDGGNPWQRIFDFGDNGGAEGSQGTARSYLHLVPYGSSTGVRASFSINGSSNEVRVTAPAPLGTGAMHQVAVVVDASHDTLQLYIDGALVESASFTGSLAAINDVNNWLGRSQYATDPEFGGTLHDFRIYNAALTEAQLQLSFVSGPTPAFLSDY
jgi:hypothetical protein